MLVHFSSIFSFLKNFRLPPVELLPYHSDDGNESYKEWKMSCGGGTFSVCSNPRRTVSKTAAARFAVGRDNKHATMVSIDDS